MAPRRMATASSGRLQQPDQVRPAKLTDPLYASAQWKAFRQHLIKQRGWRCEDPKCQTPRGPWTQIYGHHIVELTDNGQPFDPANVLLVCSTCHGRLTAENKMKRAGWIDPLENKPTG